MLIKKLVLQFNSWGTFLTFPVIQRDSSKIGLILEFLTLQNRVAFVTTLVFNTLL